MTELGTRPLSQSAYVTKVGVTLYNIFQKYKEILSSEKRILSNWHESY